MARDWEQQFRQWASPPGKTEQTRCENAVSAIRNAIKASDKLKARNIDIFIQGSYRNRTNVRRDSDVDIGVVCNDVFFKDLPEGKTDRDFGFSDASYGYAQFKNELGEALVDYLGKEAVDRGNKAFDVHETSYHVDADVAAFVQYRRYVDLRQWHQGVELRTDRESKRIINWPEQHYENGVAKNTATGKRYKAIARVLKSLANEMNSAGLKEGNVPGFLIECLVWNTPDMAFQHPSYIEDVGYVIASIYGETNNSSKISSWVEVSKLKYLFHPVQKWTMEQANAFAAAAWVYTEMS